jgi:hypothetical protein
MVDGWHIRGFGCCLLIGWRRGINTGFGVNRMAACTLSARWNSWALFRASREIRTPFRTLLAWGIRAGWLPWSLRAATSATSRGDGNGISL